MKFQVFEKSSKKLIGEFKSFYDAENAVIDLDGDEDTHDIVVDAEGLDMRCPVCGHSDHGAEAIGDLCCDKCGNVIFAICGDCGKYMRSDGDEYITVKRGGDEWDFCRNCRK